MKATVVRSTGSWYRIRKDDGSSCDARIRGKFRLDGLNTTNPIAVGDRVECNSDEEGREVITGIEPRRNYIIRRSNNLSRQRQILAANLDRAILLITLAAPATSTGFIDRFLLTCEAYHVPALLLINKCDLLEGAEAEIEAFAEMYRRIGYPVMLISALHGEGLEPLQALLRGQTTLLSGHSGAGKSTLINRLIPGLDLKTGAISAQHQKGKHTTTFAEMHFLDDPEGGAIIDTPGIRDLGVVDLEAREIGHYFVEFRPLLNQCRFHNCRHLNEPGCAVLAAVESGTVSAERYYNYLSILHNEDIYR
jgi:ribosome biogenesis GTPase